MHGEILFQLELLDTVKIYIISSISLNLVVSWSNMKIKKFSDWYLVQHSHYLRMVDVMLPLHNFVFGVIC